MPTVIILMSIMAVVAYAALLQSNNSLNLAYKQAYIQMARVASKAAIDYAQEQFDTATCGNYAGTAEQDLISNDRYRVTYRAEVTETSVDGYEKTIKGTGSVYLPRLSATAQYVFDIRSEIIRTYALCKTPDNFGPVVWLDASDFQTLKKPGPPTTSAASQAGNLGVLDLLLPNDTVEEKVSNGNQGLASWLSDDLEMHTCDSLEFALLDCTGTTANRDLYVGMVFPNVTVPQGATVTSATIRVSGSTPSGSGGSVTHRIYGLYNTATNPHLPFFTPSIGASNQVRSRMLSGSLHTVASTTESTNNIPPGNPVNFDVTSVVQEMVNNINWNPAANGGRIGFGIQRTAGTGIRKVCKGNVSLLNLTCVGRGPSIAITYANNVILQADNGDSISEWHDKSGNGNHARLAYGNAPIRVDNQINGLTVVRFNNGTLLTALTSALSNERELTVFAVARTNFASSSSGGRLLTGMHSSGTNDTSGSNGIIPLFRNANTSNFSSQYSSNSATYRTSYSCGASCNTTPYIYASIFSAAEDPVTAILKGQGTPVASSANLAPPTGSPPYTFTIDQFYIGGRRNGTMAAGAGTEYLNGDYAEIVIYDRALDCREIEALEEYFRNKWAISPSAYTSTCPVDTIPTL